MEYTTIKTKLDDIASEMAASESEINGMIARAADISANLESLATRYGDTVTAIQALGTTETRDLLAKSELAGFVAIRDKLKTAADAIAAALA